MALRPENVAKAKSQAARLFEALVTLQKQYHQNPDDEGPWIFGSSTGPTILDAHAAAYIARLLDAGQDDLVPKELVEFAKKVTALPAWEAVTKGRSTIFNADYGQVSSLSPNEI